MFLISLLGVINIFTAGSNAERVIDITLRKQSEEYLVNLTIVTAENHDLQFQRARHDVEQITSYAAIIFSHPEWFNPSSYWQAENKMTFNQNGDYVSNDGDIGSSIAVPGGPSEPDETLEKLALLDFLFIPVYESHPNALLVTMTTKEGIARSYPALDLPDFAAPPLEIFLSPPYYQEATPQNNPEREVVLTTEFEELIGLGLVVTASAPVYTDAGDFVGVVSLDLSVDRLTAQIEATSPLADGYSLLIGESGSVIALPEAGYAALLGRPYSPGLGPNLSEAVPGFAPVQIAMQNGETGFQEVIVDKKELSVA